MRVPLDAAIRAARIRTAKCKKRRGVLLSLDVVGQFLIEPAVKTACEWGVPLGLMALQEDFGSAYAEKRIAQQITAAAEAATVPICFHLDHARVTDVNGALDKSASLDLVKKWLDLGCTSVMLDAHDLPLAENLDLTQTVYEMACGYGASIETEEGDPAGTTQTGISLGAGRKTTLADFQTMDAALHPSVVIAVAVGNRHNGVTPPEDVDLELARTLAEAACRGRAFAIHGGSGMGLDLLAQMFGMTAVDWKLNLYADNRKAVWGALRQAIQSQSDAGPPLKYLIDPVEQAVVQVIETRLQAFGYTRP